MIQEVDQYLVDGCGRCEYYQTDKCKARHWTNELVALRSIVLACGLTEEYKWSQPCYTYQGNNVLIVTAFKDYACISFFKGSLLHDEKALLTTPGKSSQAAKQFRFTNLDQIEAIEADIKAYIHEAIEIEKAGLKVNFKKQPEEIPAELNQAFSESASFKEAFYALTPGRQRGYILHFSQPKQSKTRMDRISKNYEKIMRGEGIHDAYRKGRK